MCKNQYLLEQVYFPNTNESVITHEGQQGADVCRSVMRSKVCARDHILYGRNFSSPQQIHEQIMAFSWVRRGLWVLIAALICVSAEKGPESRSGLILELQAALNELVEDGKGYLGKLAGKQTVLSVFKVSYGRIAELYAYINNWKQAFKVVFIFFIHIFPCIKTEFHKVETI